MPRPRPLLARPRSCAAAPPPPPAARGSPAGPRPRAPPRFAVDLPGPARRAGRTALAPCRILVIPPGRALPRAASRPGEKRRSSSASRRRRRPALLHRCSILVVCPPHPATWRQAAASRSYALPCLLSSDPPPHRRCPGAASPRRIRPNSNATSRRPSPSPPPQAAPRHQDLAGADPPRVRRAGVPSPPPPHLAITRDPHAMN